MGLFSKLAGGLKKTRDSMVGMVEGVLNSFTKIDEELFEELEEILILSDVGVATSQKICEELRRAVKKKGLKDASQVKEELRAIITDLLSIDNEMHLDTKPSIVLVIGVNGVGKTTAIGKMAARYKAEGKKVVLAAADTFRAAAIDQLAIWAERSDAILVKQGEGSDPAAVIFDAIHVGKAKGADVIICDTAGRLHNKKNLMDELGKIARVIAREAEGLSVENLLVLDATTGQNGVNQARIFQEVTGLSGIVLTKLDGTAKGGVVLAISDELGLPVKFVGVGEQIDDLQTFDAKQFANALFGEENQPV